MAATSKTMCIKETSYLTYESRELRFIQFLYTLKHIPNRIYARKRQNSKREFEKLAITKLTFLERAECRHFTLLFCDLL